jgi:hypothetical protein
MGMRMILVQIVLFGSLNFEISDEQDYEDAFKKHWMERI